MSEVSTWNVYAYMDVDGVLQDENRRGVPEWRIEDVLRWCRSRGFDNIYMHRDETVVFKKAAPVPGVVHRLGDERSAA